MSAIALTDNGLIWAMELRNGENKIKPILLLLLNLKIW